MASIIARTIKNIIKGGAVNAGHGVFFTLLFDDESQESYHCDFGLMPKLLGNLKQYATMADAVRTHEKAGELSVSAPYIVDRISNSGHGNNGQIIALEVVVSDGFPIELAMSPDLARQTIERLEMELRRAADVPPPDRRN